jgi:hypothetical protein
MVLESKNAALQERNHAARLFDANAGFVYRNHTGQAVTAIFIDNKPSFG